MDRTAERPAIVAAGRNLAASPGVRRLVRVGLAAEGIALLIVFLGIGGVMRGTFGFDAYSYWGFPRADLYAGTQSANGFGAYRYSPFFLPLLELFSRLDWWTFSFLWFCLGVATYLWLTGRWWLPALAFAPISFELYHGNIHLLLAAAVVLGFRYPATWAFVLLTKVTPGVGLLWFALRREWRSLGIALGVTAMIVVLGLLTAPGVWLAWFQTLTSTAAANSTNQVAIPLPIRLLLAAAIVSWGAMTDRRWTVVAAATLGLPTLWDTGEAMLIGVIPLLDPLWETGSPAARLRRWFRGRWRSRAGAAPARADGAPAA